MSLNNAIFDLLEQQLGLTDHVTRLDHLRLAQTLPIELLDVEHLDDLGSRERHKRLDSNRQLGSDLQSDVQNGLNALRVSLYDLPRLGIGQIFVTQTGEVHSLLQRLAEAVALDVLLQSLADAGHLGQRLAVVVGQLACRGHNAVVVLLREHQRAVHEVAEDRHQLVVVASLEVLPSEVVILGLGGICAQHVAQNVLLTGELIEVLVQPYSPIARGRDLVTFEVQELVCGHVLGQDITAVRLQHRGEHDAVEDDVVLTDEVHHLGILALPIFLPIGRKILSSRDITNRSVEPNVEHLTLGTLNRNGDTPIQVAAHGTGLQTAVEPALALTIDVRFPLLVTLQDPLAQHLLVLIEGQIPVLGLAHHGLRARNGTLGVDQVGRIERRAALLALVAIGAVVAALGAGTGDVTVSEEGLSLLVVVLLRSSLRELTLIVQCAEELRRCLSVGGRGCTRVDVERHTQTLERRFDYVVILIDDVLRRNALFSRLDCDGHTVLIATADRDHILAALTQITNIDIRRHINARQVADMHGTIGVGQCRSYQITLKLFLHLFMVRIYLSN